jgi:hypothetical protein
VAPELRLVALAELRISAELGAGREHHTLGRGRIEDDIGRDQKTDRDEDKRAAGEEQVAHRDQRDADDPGQG